MTTQTSFLGGEISPLAYMRRDRPFYEHGMAALKNQTLRLQGATETRPGTVDHGALPSGEILSLKWVFSPSQSYNFMLSDQRYDVVNNQTQQVVVSALGMPWTEAHLARLTIAQRLDTMIVFHPDLATQVITRTGAASFSVSPFFFDYSDSLATRALQPHYKFAAPNTFVTPSATTGTITVTASAPTWVPGHVGARLRIGTKEVEVASYVSPTVVTAFVREALASTAATTDWTEQVFSGARGYPHCGAFYGDRLIFGGAKSLPLGFWLSKIGRYFNFDLGTSQDSDAIWDAIGDEVASEIRHMIVDRHLLVLGDTGVFMVANSETAPLTPKNFKIPIQARVGASYCHPASFDGGVVFVQDGTNIVRSIRYNDLDQRYQVDVINQLAPHVLDAPKRIAAIYAAAPRQENIAVFVNADGTIGHLLSDAQNEIQAWTPWELGGGLLAEDAVAVNDTIWIVAARGGARRLLRLVFEGAPLDMAVGSPLQGTPTNVFPGFSAFAGETVDVWANGHALGKGVVDGAGVLTIEEFGPQARAVIAGYAFEQKIVPLPYFQTLNGGQSTHGHVLGLRRVHVDVEESGWFLVAGAPPPLTTGTDADSPAPTYTGTVTAYVLGYDEGAQAPIEAVLPQRLRIRGLTREVVIGG